MLRTEIEEFPVNTAPTGMSERGIVRRCERVTLLTRLVQSRTKRTRNVNACFSCQ